MTRVLFPLAIVCLLTACQTTGEVHTPDADPDAPTAPASAPASAVAPGSGTPLAPAPKEGEAVATFAGGCFWCMEPPFEKLEGVSAVLSGYTGGPEKGPTYKQVAGHTTGHTEAVIVYYDPAKVTYEKLVATYWRAMDPTDPGGQFADRGASYRTAIFVHNEEQRAVATKSKAELEASGRFDKPIVVPIQDAEPFWVAEDYHQDFYKKDPDHYGRYRRGSGRSGFLAKVWGDGSSELMPAPQ